MHLTGPTQHPKIPTNDFIAAYATTAPRNEWKKKKGNRTELQTKGKVMTLSWRREKSEHLKEQLHNNIKGSSAGSKISKNRHTNPTTMK